MNSIKRNSPATPGGMDMDNKDTIASMGLICIFSIAFLIIEGDLVFTGNVVE